MKLRLPDWLTFFIKQFAQVKVPLLLVSVLTAAIAWCGTSAPLYIGRIIDEVSGGHWEKLPAYSSLLLITLLAIELFSVIRTYISKKTMLTLTYDLIERSLTSVFHTTSSFFTRVTRGELLQRCVKDTRTIQQFGLFTIPTLVQELLLGCAAVVVISRIYWPAAAIVVLAYVLLFIPIYWIGRKRRESRRMLANHQSFLRQRLLEKLESVKQIKLFGMERREYEDFMKDQEKWTDLTLQREIVDSTYQSFPRIPDSLAPALVFLLVGRQVMSGEATIGQLMTIIAFIPALNAPVRSLFSLYATLADIRVRLMGIMQYLRLPVESGRKRGLLRIPEYRRMRLTFHRVSIHSDRGELLRNVSFTVQPGEHVAIVGPSGAGKSTLLKLIARLLEPAEGGIFLGDVPIHQIDSTHLRSRIGYVTQEVVLFRDTLYRNVTMLHPAERAELDDWFHAFDAYDIIQTLPSGYDTVLGDNGASLSGGQRQIVSLIRTLLKKPDLLLLDEATSALDPASEAVMMEKLHAFCADTAMIHVTHRLQTAAQADRILVMDKGRLIQNGTHNELLQDEAGLYARLWLGGTNTMKQRQSYVQGGVSGVGRI